MERVALLAIAVALLALVVPGLLAIPLLATAGAAALDDGSAATVLGRAAAAAQRRLPLFAALAVGAIGVDIAIAALARHVILAPDAKHDLAAALTYLRVVALGVLVISPVVAGALATAYARNRAR
jgi:hypothetical protein